MSNDEEIDKPSYWLTKAAAALDNAVQLTGDDYTNEIDKMEDKCDWLARQYRGQGR